MKLPLLQLRHLRRLYSHTPSRYHEPWPLHSLTNDRLAPPPSAHPLVALFWDLDNKPSLRLHPYDAAVRLKLAASSFGTLRYYFAFANPHSLTPYHNHPPPENTTNLCRVCGRKFRSNLSLINHFEQIHKREQEKRVRRVESARGARRVRLVAAMSGKMHKYRTAARDLLAVGGGVGEEIRRAGFVVREVADKPDAAMSREAVRLLERRAVGCVVLVSDDLGFAGVLGMARERGVRTVVVGGEAGEGLRRCADSGYLWREVLSGKTRKAAGAVVGSWKDREVLKNLEWTYRPERGEEVETVGDEHDMENSCSEMEMETEDGSGQWWELDSDDNRPV